ncbi:hypothetical protein D3C84_1219740 [compost metagenome]
MPTRAKNANSPRAMTTAPKTITVRRPRRSDRWPNNGADSTMATDSARSNINASVLPKPTCVA